MSARRAVGVAAALLVSASATASAAGTALGDLPPLPIGTDTHGVRAHFVHSDVVFTFARSAAGRYRRIAGRTVKVGCVAIVRTTHSGAATDKIWAGHRLIAPRRRAPLRVFVGERHGRPDYCVVLLVRRGASTVEVAVVPISARGARYLDERSTVREIVGLLLLTQASSGTPSSAARMQALTGGQVVPVSGPEQRPPTGHVGYWTDGKNEVYLGALTHTGTLLFYQYEISSDIVTTNILDWLNGQDDR